MIIYKTTNTINGKQYIGLCTRDDPGYLGSGSLIKSAIKKYGKKNFKRETLEECDTFEKLLEREEYWIKKYDAVNNENFYNLSYGGYAGNSKILKEYWNSMSSEERKSARKWNGYFANIDQTADKHISKNDKLWSNKVSVGVKRTWDTYPKEERKSRANNIKKSIQNRDYSGKNNPMFGRSAVKEQNLRWYTNGTETLYITEGTQPEGYRRGRAVKRKEVVADYD